MLNFIAVSLINTPPQSRRGAKQPLGRRQDGARRGPGGADRTSGPMVLAALADGEEELQHQPLPNIGSGIEAVRLGSRAFRDK